MVRLNYKKLTSKKGIATEIQHRTIMLVQQAMDDDKYIFEIIKIHRQTAQDFTDAENKQLANKIAALDRANSNLIAAGNKLFDYLQKYQKKK